MLTVEAHAIALYDDMEIIPCFLLTPFHLSTGNLYYALTHAPEPLTDEYSRALSWEAATERFAAAGSVSVAEAQAMKEALESAEAGFDVSAKVSICNNSYDLI